VDDDNNNNNNNGFKKWCDGMNSTVLEIDVGSSEFCEYGHEQKYSFVQEHLPSHLSLFSASPTGVFHF
jgi:hypothetical protein